MPMSLLLNLKGFHTLFWCFHCSKRNLKMILYSMFIVAVVISINSLNFPTMQFVKFWCNSNHSDFYTEKLKPPYQASTVFTWPREWNPDNMALSFVALPSQNLIVQSQQQKQYKKVWNVFKVNYKYTRTTSMTVFLLLTLNMFHTCSLLFRFFTIKTWKGPRSSHSRSAPIEGLFLKISIKSQRNLCGWTLF